MNATSAFTRACSGSLTDESAGVFDQFMSGFYDRYQNLTGWLSNTLDVVKETHQNFMESRMWEFSNRINGKEGMYVGRFDIGYLSEVQYQQQATGFMRDYIMANPLLMGLYEEDRVSGYDGEFGDLCTGVGRENYYYNKSMDGKVHYDEEGKSLTRTVFNSTRDSLTRLSFKERADIQRTWRATNIHIANNLFDPTSIENKNILSLEEVQALKEKEEE